MESTIPNAPLGADGGVPPGAGLLQTVAITSFSATDRGKIAAFRTPSQPICCRSNSCGLLCVILCSPATSGHTVDYNVGALTGNRVRHNVTIDSAIVYP